MARKAIATPVFLEVGVDAETAAVVDHRRKVQIAFFHECLELDLADHRQHHLTGVLVGHFGGQIHQHQVGVDSHHRRHSDIDVNVAGPVFDGFCQHFLISIMHTVS
jgi:hypothetical protein